MYYFCKKKQPQSKKSKQPFYKNEHQIKSDINDISSNNLRKAGNESNVDNIIKIKFYNKKTNTRKNKKLKSREKILHNFN